MRVAILPNQQRELFAQQVAAGLVGQQAYLVAYPTAKAASARANAARLLAIAGVRARIAELQQPAIQQTQVTAERVIAEYARIAFADMRRFASVEHGGIRLKASADWSDDDAAAVAELAQTTAEHGGSLRFKLHSKIAALDALARIYGMADSAAGGETIERIIFERRTRGLT